MDRKGFSNARFARLRAGLRRKEINCLCTFRHDYAALDSLRSLSGQAHKPPQEAKIGLAWGPR